MQRQKQASDLVNQYLMNPLLDQNTDQQRTAKPGPLRDFTLTNVRQNSKLYDIKIAIEKLKGYKIECQSLSLVDEEDLINKGYS